MRGSTLGIGPGSSPAVWLENRPGGVISLQSTDVLGAFANSVGEVLEHWAKTCPDRTFIAQRGGKGWRRLSYAETLATIRDIGQSLLSRGLSPERPIAILSGNDIEHALLGLAALYCGIPYAPISPAYSLISKDHAKLRQITALLTPGLIFAADGGAYASAINAVLPKDCELVVTANPPAGAPATPFSTLTAASATAGVDAAHNAVAPDTIAKFLFTSGSVGAPKCVINTHRMLCSNQAMIRHPYAFALAEPPVLVDWLPWHHTAGGNNNFGFVLFNGGSLYIDDGKPTESGIGATVRNLREIAPTVQFSVPRGYEALLPHLRADAELCRKFFSRLRMMQYAGAAMAAHIWETLTTVASDVLGRPVPMSTGFGCTESGPSAFSSVDIELRPGVVGLPLPGVEVKLVPTGGRYEARIKGPSITPGYWRQPELTQGAFDEEGFYRMGDALGFADPGDPTVGLVFQGRLTEDFKLSSGTWVCVGQLRKDIIDQFAPLISDVVIAGHDRSAVAALVFPNLDACRSLATASPAAATPGCLLAQSAIRAAFEARLEAMAACSTGSSNRLTRLILLDEPPSLDAHEITDKGSLNQRAVLTHRAAIVDEIYADPPSSRVIAIEERS